MPADTRQSGWSMGSTWTSRSSRESAASNPHCPPTWQESPNRSCLNAPPGTSLSSVGGYAQFSDYLRNALIAQLSAIDSYAEPAAVTLSGTLSRLEMYLDRTVAEPTLGGTWSIALELRSSLGAASVFSIEHTRPIGSGNAYCQAMVDGFMEADQELLTTTLRSREFRALLDPESAS